MTRDNCDQRPRILIDANRDGQSATWRRHPASKGELAATPGAALDAALAEIGGEDAVIIYARYPPP